MTYFQSVSLGGFFPPWICQQSCCHRERVRRHPRPFLCTSWTCEASLQSFRTQSPAPCCTPAEGNKDIKRLSLRVYSCVPVYFSECEWHAHHQLVNFCFHRSFIRGVCSLTLLLVLGALLLFALFFCFGPFQNKVIRFDIWLEGWVEVEVDKVGLASWRGAAGLRATRVTRHESWPMCFSGLSFPELMSVKEGTCSNVAQRTKHITNVKCIWLFALRNTTVL